MDNNKDDHLRYFLVERERPDIGTRQVLLYSPLGKYWELVFCFATPFDCFLWSTMGLCKASKLFQYWVKWSSPKCQPSVVQIYKTEKLDCCLADLSNKKNCSSANLQVLFTLLGWKLIGFDVVVRNLTPIISFRHTVLTCKLSNFKSQKCRISKVK